MAWAHLMRLLGMALLALMGLVAVYLEAAPLGLAADARPSPDLLFLVVAYWSVRRPGTAALPVVFGLGLMRDLLTDTPVGLGALSLVLAAEYLKAIGPALARWRFVAEWLIVGLTMAAMLLLQWLGVLLLLAHPPYLSDLGLQCLLSLALYPALALVLRWLFGISRRKPEPA